ncbi:MAG: hypothetical protein WAW42_02830, partial [Candidatus Competibacteraceae bacterium]
FIYQFFFIYKDSDGWIIEPSLQVKSQSLLRMGMRVARYGGGERFEEGAPEGQPQPMQKARSIR